MVSASIPFLRMATVNLCESEVDRAYLDAVSKQGRLGRRDLKILYSPLHGVGTSAVFLQEFTNYPWAHLDIAGMALSEKAGDYTPSGATGYGVRLLLAYLQAVAAGS